MALVTDGWEQVLTFVDNGGNETTRRHELRATSYAQAQTMANAIADAYRGLSDCAIKQSLISERFVEDAFVFPAAGVQMENQILLSFQVQDKPNKSATWTVPGPKQSAFIFTSGPGANLVNTSAAIVGAFVDLFKSTGAASSSFISDGESVESLVGARRIHRRNTNG